MSKAYSSMADPVDYNRNHPALGAPSRPFRSPSGGNIPQTTLPLYRKWTSITFSEYRKADSNFVFVWRHPIFQSMLVLAITLWSYNGDVWLKEIAIWSSQRTDEGKARAVKLATNEIGKLSDFGYWIAWQLYFLALTLSPLYPFMCTEERARIPRLWAIAVLTSISCMGFVVLSVMAYPFMLFDPSKLRDIPKVMGLVSICRIVTAPVVIIALLYNHYWDIRLCPASDPSLPFSVGRQFSYAVSNKKEQ